MSASAAIVTIFAISVAVALVVFALERRRSSRSLVVTLPPLGDYHNHVWDVVELEQTGEPVTRICTHPGCDRVEYLQAELAYLNPKDPTHPVWDSASGLPYQRARATPSTVAYLSTAAGDQVTYENVTNANSRLYRKRDYILERVPAKDDPLCELCNRPMDPVGNHGNRHTTCCEHAGCPDGRCDRCPNCEWHDLSVLSVAWPVKRFVTRPCPEHAVVKNRGPVTPLLPDPVRRERA